MRKAPLSSSSPPKISILSAVFRLWFMSVCCNLVFGLGARERSNERERERKSNRKNKRKIKRKEMLRVYPYSICEAMKKNLLTPSSAKNDEKR